jgi:predicted Zn-dependent protease
VRSVVASQCGTGGLSARLREAVAALLLATALVGCAANGHPDEQLASLPDLTKPADPNPATQREHQRILLAYGGAYQNPRVEALISKTVDRLVAASERPDLHYKVTILNSPAINAFALPNGHLYVTRGLVALANDTSELASVLSHEMAHVIARHAAIREDQIRIAALRSRVATDLFNDPQMGALALAKSKIALATFSRGQELEADGIGVGISSRAGFDAYGGVRFLGAMERTAELKPAAGALAADPKYLDFLSSHPATPDRIKVTQANARQYSGPGRGERDRAEYLSSIDGLVYGEDPSEGFVRGRRFLHPRLGFVFTAPEGFALDNTSQAVLGMDAGGNDALRLDVVQVSADQRLTDYLTSGWIENVDPTTVRDISINGFATATGVAKSDQWSFQLYALRFGSDVYRFIFATKQPSPEKDQAFRASIDSFRRMTPAEIQTAKPLRVQVITVKASDTPELLAGQMAVQDRALERFLILNGLQPSDHLKPGDQVKVVSE